MNSANGVLIVADHDRFLHTSNIIIMVHTLCNAADDCRFRALTIKPPSDFLILKTKNGRKPPTKAAITTFGTDFICST